ncbi:MAG: Calx-beta domain-containing protein [Methylotenera sp.]|nr:Calx-beta domain-containing protein [Methylotenera sp.]
MPTLTDTITGEPLETVPLTIGGVTGTGGIIDTTGAPTISTVEPGSPVTTDDNVNEGSNLVFNVSVSGTSLNPTSFAFTLGGGTATVGTDYSNTPVFSNGVTYNAGTGLISVPAGVTSFSVTVPTLTDTITGEPLETVPLTIGGVTGTGGIIDTTGAPTISIVGTDAIEGNPLSFAVTLSNPSAIAVVYPYELTGSADAADVGMPIFTNGVIFDAEIGTITIPAGVTSFTIVYPTVDDSVFEGNETVVVNIVSAAGSANILDNDSAPIVNAISVASADEGTALVHTVTLSNASTQDSTFAYSLTGATATAGVDFDSTPIFSDGVTLSGGFVTVPAGVTSFTVTIPTIDDLIKEDDETTTLTIGGVTGAGTIVDNDTVPTLSINSVSVNEAAGTATFTVSLNAVSGQTVSVSYATSNGTATAGSDFTSTSGSLTFAPGVITQTITVPIADDTLFEGNESFNVVLSAPSNATIAVGTGVGTIVDNDAAPIVSSVSAASVTEGGDLVHTVSLSNASSATTTFSYSLTGSTAIAGTDFDTTASFSNGVTLSGGILTVPAGVASFTVTYATLQDALDEANETTALTIGGITAVGTIVDDDPTPTLSINSVSVNEAAGTATFTVTLNAVSGQAVSVNYATSNGTATAGSDYTSTTGSLTFAPGVVTQTITVPIINDTLAEASETFNVVLSAPSNATIATGTGVATIIDNDQPPGIDLDGNNSTVAGNNYVTSYTENGAGVSIADSDIAITDVDSTSLASATITLTNAQAGDVLTVGLLPAGISSSVAGNVVTLSGAASLADYQTAIRAVTFSSSSENPSTTPRVISVVVNDGQSNSNIATATINVVAVNDAPVAAADNYSATEGATVVRGNVLANDTDVDSPLASLAVAQFATNSGSAAVAVNGTNTVTTALGGTVVMNADGTFTYTAPVRNHADAIADVDNFVYRATDGALNSAWTTVSINVADSAPVANNDVDSVGVGGTITGNVITGAGGNVTGGADSFVDVPTTVSSVTFGATTYTIPVGGRTIATTNGTLVIQQDGSYSYTSSYQTKALAAAGNASVGEWTAAGFNVYGFDTNGTQTNDLYGGNTNSINTLNLNATAATRVSARNNGNNDTGIGVENSSTTGTNARIQTDENLVIDIGFATKSASVTLTALSAIESAVWQAYDTAGNIVGSGTITGNAAGIVTSTLTTASGYRYIVLNSTGATYLVNGLTAPPDISGVTPDAFSYTLTDGDGTISNVATLTITTDTVVSATADSATVYEGGLAAGTQAGLLATTATGNLLANDAGVTPTTTVTSINGVAANGSGIITVSNVTGGTLVVNANTGAYTYTLTGATTEGVNDTPTFNYVLTDSATGQTTNANLVVNVVDDAPIGGDVVKTLQAASAALTYNIVIILDRSGSMAWDANGNNSGSAAYDPTTNRMQIAKEAVAKMIDRYDDLGNVNVKIVDFSDTVSQSTWYVDNKTGAVSYVDGLQSGGGTRYSTALDATMTGFTQPAADKTLIYFVTDGEPTSGYAVGATQQTQWQSFVDANADIAFGIGIGAASLNSLLPIAYPNVDADGNGTEDYAIRVNNPADLSDTLLATVDGGVVIGNVSVLSGNGTSGLLLGADGGKLQSVVVDGLTYTYNGTGPSSMVITTLKGGQLTVDFLDGSYIYQLTVNQTIQNEQEVFHITAIDNDGDTKAINLTINLDYLANLDTNRDIVLTNVTTGVPVEISAEALMHNDTVRGTGAISSTQNAINGTVTGTSNVQFTANAVAAKNITVVTQSSDSVGTPVNNTHENAVDLTDRSKFGTVVVGTPAWVVDTPGSSIVFSGGLNNSGTVRDIDYVKVKMYAGERVFIDVDNQTQGVNASVEYYNAAGILQTFNVATTGTGTGLAPNGYFTAPETGEFFIRLQTSGTGTTSNTNYDLVLTLDNIAGPMTPSGEFDYTVTEDGVSTTATATVFNVVGNTITGSDADEILIGGATSDVLIGGAGNDVLIGGAGEDQLFGGAGADRLEGGAVNDTLDGGTGNDVLIGGAGNDILTGGSGADVFKWSLADAGQVGLPATDVITDFDTVAGGDKLDLRDLLQGENAQGISANLEDYLHFEKVGGDTVVHISNTGAYGSGFNVSQDVQLITLQGVDLVTGFTDDQAIIQDLLARQKIITD